MIPAAFNYHSPTTLDEALALLARHGFDAKVLAGGQSLIPMMRFRLAEPTQVVDVNRIAGLDRLEESEEWLHIGSRVRHARLEHTDWVRERYPLLAEAAGVIADPLVRNRGTVGGSLVHADPAGDWGSVMLAAGAKLVVRKTGGKRVISIDDLFLGPFTTSLEPDEMLVEIRLPRAESRQGGAYEKLERKVGDFATVGVAVQLTLDDSGVCAASGVGLTAVGPTNLRASRAQADLIGSLPDETRIARAAVLAAEESSPAADNRGSEEYKRDMVRVLTIRALRRAVARAEGASHE